MNINEARIDVKSVCGNKIYTRDHGRVLYNLIAQKLPKNERIVVEFDGNEIASESFLDEAIIEHYIHPISLNSEKKIILDGMTKSDQMLMNKIYGYRMRLEKKEATKNGSKSKRAA